MRSIDEKNDTRDARVWILENSGKSPAKPKQGRPRTEFTGMRNLRVFLGSDDNVVEGVLVYLPVYIKGQHYCWMMVIIGW